MLFDVSVYCDILDVMNMYCFFSLHNLHIYISIKMDRHQVPTFCCSVHVSLHSTRCRVFLVSSLLSSQILGTGYWSNVFEFKKQ